MPEERILDCRGLLGPMPAVKTKRALADLQAGTLTVMVDTEMASRTVARAAERAGWAATVAREGGEWHVRVVKGEPGEAAAPGAQAAGQTVVWVSKPTVGQGDDALGAVLMKAFLYALGELPAPPGTFVLSNAGVRLAVEGSDHLEILRSLAEAGAQILVCSTCLDYFGLAGQLAVGRAATMYEIVEALVQAPKMLCP